MIKPEFWDDEKLAKVSRDARLTYIGFWNFCDDYGTTKANLLWLKSRIFPFDDKLSIKEFEKWIAELIDIKRIFKFSENGDNYYYLPNFTKHQVINRPSKNRYPEPSTELLEHSLSTHGALSERMATENENICTDNKHSLSTHGALTDEREVEREIERERETKYSGGALTESFGIFYSAYPKRKNKLDALKAWKKTAKVRPPIETVLLKIKELSESEDWKREGGKFIPYPATWLNRGGWDDEVKNAKSCKPPTWDD